LKRSTVIKPYYNKSGITIYQGDARFILPSLETESVDAVITDPPYGINFQPRWGKTKAIKNDHRRDAKSLWWAILPDLFRILRANTASVFFAGKSEEWVKPLLEEWFEVKGAIVWRKNFFGLGYYLRPQWELAWYVHKAKPALPAVAISDVWDFKRDYKLKHSCQKPIALLKHAIQFCGGELILDPFIGSGSTLCAAQELGRRAIGVELEEEYCELAAKRLEELHG
jgi:site-specific DNA-methyltransferase (adenine-specific)